MDMASYYMYLSWLLVINLSLLLFFFFFFFFCVRLSDLIHLYNAHWILMIADTPSE